MYFNMRVFSSLSIQSFEKWGRETSRFLVCASGLGYRGAVNCLTGMCERTIFLSLLRPESLLPKDYLIDFIQNSLFIHLPTHLIIFCHLSNQSAHTCQKSTKYIVVLDCWNRKKPKWGGFYFGFTVWEEFDASWRGKLGRKVQSWRWE